MLDQTSEGNSLSNGNRKPAEFLRELQAAGYPVVLTINGQAELVVKDAASYQKLIELAERAEDWESLTTSVDEMKAGKGRPIEELFAEMEQVLVEKKVH